MELLDNYHKAELDVVAAKELNDEAILLEVNRNHEDIRVKLNRAVQQTSDVCMRLRETIASKSQFESVNTIPTSNPLLSSMNEADNAIENQSQVSLVNDTLIKIRQSLQYKLVVINTDTSKPSEVEVPLKSTVLFESAEDFLTLLFTKIADKTISIKRFRELLTTFHRWNRNYGVKLDNDNNVIFVKLPWKAFRKIPKWILYIHEWQEYSIDFDKPTKLPNNITKYDFAISDNYMRINLREFPWVDFCIKSANRSIAAY